MFGRSTGVGWERSVAFSGRGSAGGKLWFVDDSSRDTGGGGSAEFRVNTKTVKRSFSKKGYSRPSEYVYTGGSPLLRIKAQLVNVGTER